MEVNKKLREYIVTLKKYEYLEDFYRDIENPGGFLYIPNRAVQCNLRRPGSRNTHYLLYDDEAELIRNDPRVLFVELTPEEQGLIIHRNFIQIENFWNKGPSQDSNHRNWGLLRVSEGNPRPNWGSDINANQSGTVSIDLIGRNVDVVIVDGIIDPSHPEFAVNTDGSGGSRIIAYNWFQHDLGFGTGNYSYTRGTNINVVDDNNHGCHVAGNVCGNTNGWARAANIYNINPYSTDINGINPNLLIDYIRAFHANKPINPQTLRKNPTICNHSWGYIFLQPISGITSVNFRGSNISGPFSPAELLNYGIITINLSGTFFAIAPARVNSVDIDMIDAMNEGVIMVGAAGNESTKIDLIGGIDYNNSFIWNGNVVFYHRGSSPSSATGCICVGAISSLANESKASFSNCGPRIDVYAPGSNIMSSLNVISLNWPGTDDVRNSVYKIGKANGTSTSSPQVTGVLACVLEKYSNMNQSLARDYLFSYSKINQIPDGSLSFSNFASLQGSENRFLYFNRNRLVSGNVFPETSYFIRSPQLKQKYPRVNLRFTNNL
jgi:hypothetical protein